MGNRKTKRRPVRKFHGNQFASMKKVDRLEQDNAIVGSDLRTASPPEYVTTGRYVTSNESYDYSSEGFSLFDWQCVNNMLSMVACSQCFSVSAMSVQLIGSKKQGLSQCFHLLCSNCGYKSPDMYTSVRKDKTFEVNRRAVYAFREIGCGHSEMVTFCYLMDLPPPPQKSAYHKHIHVFNEVTTQLAKETMLCAASDLAKNSGECAVSVDGTWMKRGFTSLVGVVTVISVKNGKILDTEVMSKQCMSCRKHMFDDKESPAYLKWKAEHSSMCCRNYTGSSPNMEPVGASRIFLRSKESRGLEYTQYLGDGDSKSYKAVVDMDPYNGKNIEKLECVGHYQKRVGKALRCLSKEKRLGGKGKLTSHTIDKMQNYFGIALRSSTNNVKEMSEAIWTSLYHLAAGRNEGLHGKCPKGEGSWCSFQKAVATGTLDKYKPKNGLPDNVLEAVKPVYSKLTDPAMLRRCLHGKTQNQNESFNGMIWRRCPKDGYVGLKTLNFCVMDAICHYNCGPDVELEILKRGGVTVGKHTRAGVELAKDLKQKKYHLQSTPEQKTRRRYLRGRRKMKEDQNTALEGTSYDAGGF